MTVGMNEYAVRPHAKVETQEISKAVLWRRMATARASFKVKGCIKNVLLQGVQGAAPSLAL
jgi:hypothetical protein